MVNTTRKKRNTTAKSRGGRSSRSSKKSCSSSAAWFFMTLLLVVLCGGGYYYKNGLLSDWIFDFFKIDKEESVVTETQKETHPKTVAQSQKTAPKKVHREGLKSSTENTVTQGPVQKQESTKTPSVKKQTKTTTKQNSKKKETSKFVKLTYKTYHQNRWGYKVVYPSFLTQVIRSENNDGCRFADYEGTEFITYGSWNVTDASIKHLYRRKLDDNLKVTYKQLYKEENYFIKFGYTKDGRMFYMKQVIADKLKEAPVITGILFFRPESKKGSEEVIKKIFDKFPY